MDNLINEFKDYFWDVEVLIGNLKVFIDNFEEYGIDVLKS